MATSGDSYSNNSKDFTQKKMTFPSPQCLSKGLCSAEDIAIIMFIRFINNFYLQLAYRQAGNKIKINFGTSVMGCKYPAIAYTDSLASIRKKYHYRLLRLHYQIEFKIKKYLYENSKL